MSSETPEEMREYKRIYYLSHRKEYSERAKARYLKNREKEKAKANARYSYNREEMKARNSAYARKNPEKNRKWQREWKKRNRDYTLESSRAYSKRWRLLNPEEAKRAYKKWCKENPSKVAALNSARRCREKNAMPSWVDKKSIDQFYVKARRKTKETGIPHVVDHIYPLTHRLLSGLHVPCNLQVITSVANAKKHNHLPHGGISSL